MGKAVTVIKTRLKWGATAGTEAQVIDIIGIPDLGGTPNTHDVSTTEDLVEVKILGRQTLDELEFEYWFDADGANLKAVKDDERKDLFYELELNDGAGGTYTWEGQHTSNVTATDGDNPIGANITIVAMTPLVYTPAE